MSNNYQQQQQQPFGAWPQQQQQNVFGQSQNFTAAQKDFPTLAQQPAGSNTQQQVGSQQTSSNNDNPFASMSNASFTPSSAEFVPTGVIAGNEEFPDLDSAFGSGGGKKGKKV